MKKLIIRYPGLTEKIGGVGGFTLISFYQESVLSLYFHVPVVQ